jgi:hypothetical protein
MVNLRFSETLHPARWLDGRLVQLARVQRHLPETAPAIEPSRNSVSDFWGWGNPGCGRVSTFARGSVPHFELSR